MSLNTILLVEDDPIIRELVTTCLDSSLYRVFPAMTGKRMLEILSAEVVDLILLDLRLPDADGLDLIEVIRKKTNVPIIILSGKSAPSDKVAGLEKGVDDYVGKPFHPKELCARIETNIQRYRLLNKDPNLGKATLEAANKISFGNWILNRMQQQVHDASGKECALTVQDCRLLEQLIIHAPKVLSRKDLSMSIQAGAEEDCSDRAIDIRVTRIRKKLGDEAQCPQIIKTCRGLGYQLICEPKVLD